MYEKQNRNKIKVYKDKEKEKSNQIKSDGLYVV
jgi:hypothetical protein